MGKTRYISKTESTLFFFMSGVVGKGARMELSGPEIQETMTTMAGGLGGTWRNRVEVESHGCVPC